MPAQPAAPKKPLFWSAALDTSGDAEKASETDHSNVPPMLRNLKKCEACGFPVSAGRALCVECEEKKWRGQLKTPPPVAAQKGAISEPAPKPGPKPVSAPVSAPVARLRAAASATHAAPIKVPPSALASDAVSSVEAAPAAGKDSKEIAAPVVAPPVVVPTSTPPVLKADPEMVPAPGAAAPPAPAFVLSAGLEPSQSWFSRNKYILGAIVLIAATVGGILLLR